MMLEDLAYVAEIVGVILVIASLIYVARQVRQNTELLRSSARQALLSNDHAAIQLSMATADVREKSSTAEKLSFQEQWRFSLQMILEMRNREHEYLQFKAGVLDEETWRSYREVIRVSLGSERGRRWWNEFGPLVAAPGFQEIVNTMISDTPTVDRSRFGTWE